MPTVFESIDADKATLPVPSKETPEAVMSPAILKSLAVAKAVAVPALPVAEAATTFKASTNDLVTLASIALLALASV